MVITEAPLHRVAALFALYTFFSTQPSTSTPKLHSVSHVEVTCGGSPRSHVRGGLMTDSCLTDLYDAIMRLPDVLVADSLEPLRPHTTYVLSALFRVGAFHILPHARVYPLNPRQLPRERVVQDIDRSTKKVGRPSKREKKKRVNDSIASLKEWLGQTKHTYELPTGPELRSEGDGVITTHLLLSQRPVTTRTNYRGYKWLLLENMTSDVGLATLRRANETVVRRMRKIDEEAAARGLEVGGEGGERTGLSRVEKAMGELGEAESRGERGGLLCLLEGAGLEFEGN